MTQIDSDLSVSTPISGRKQKFGKLRVLFPFEGIFVLLELVGSLALPQKSLSLINRAEYEVCLWHAETADVMLRRGDFSLRV